MSAPSEPDGTRLLLVSALLALTLIALALARTPTAFADVCTGGAPYEGAGSPPASLLAAVPLLKGPRWSRESLPQWAETRASSAWGEQLAYASYHDSVLWDATSAAAWWVIPGQACGIGGGGEVYERQACVLTYAQLALVGFDCLGTQKLTAGASPPKVVRRDGRLLVSGFAPVGTGSVEVSFQNGSATFPALGGVYGGSASADLGSARQARSLPAVVTRPQAQVVLVDQTGLFSSSEGPLASTPRLRHIAARLHAHMPRVSATILGTAVTGRRAHDEVLYGPGARSLAARVRRALHAGRPIAALSGGALTMFGPVARVVVLVGRG
jgi:hypothetical protein